MTRNVDRLAEAISLRPDQPPRDQIAHERGAGAEQREGERHAGDFHKRVDAEPDACSGPNVLNKAASHANGGAIGRRARTLHARAFLRKQKAKEACVSSERLSASAGSAASICAGRRALVRRPYFTVTVMAGDMIGGLNGICVQSPNTS